MASIEVLEPNVGDELHHNVEERMEEYPLITIQNNAVDSGAAIIEGYTSKTKGVPAPVGGLRINI